MIRAVFLDQGGAFESECLGAEPTRLMLDVFEGLRLLQRAGYAVVVVTHQSGVAKGCGLLIRAASELGVDMAQSWMVGATLDDMETGRWAGCRTVLLTNGHEREWNLTESRWPDYIAGTLLEASQLIALSNSRAAARHPLDRLTRPPLL